MDSSFFFFFVLPSKGWQTINLIYMKQMFLLVLIGCITLGALASAPTATLALATTSAQAAGRLQIKTSEECCQFALVTATGAMTACDGSTYLHSESALGFACASSCEAAFRLAFMQAKGDVINLMIAEVINPVSGPPCD